MKRVAVVLAKSCGAKRLRPVGLAVACLALLFAGMILQPGYARETTVNQVGGALGSWPFAWIPVSSLNDGIDGGVAAQIDFVGDNSDPGFYQYSDGTYLYFRMRVALGTYTPGIFQESHLIMIDCGKNDASNSCTGSLDGQEDYAFAWDSKSNDNSRHGLEMMVKSTVGIAAWASSRFDDRDGNAGNKLAPPDFGAGDGYVRTIDSQTTANFGSTTFIDFAIKCSYLSANTNLRCTGQSWRIQLGSIANATDHNNITGDVAANSSPSSKAWSSSILGGIDLLSFNAQRISSRVKLGWSTGSEFDCGSFKLTRSLMGKKAGELLDTIELSPDAIACRGAAGGSAYEIEDRSARRDASYAYVLTQYDRSGERRSFGPLVLKSGDARASYLPK